MRVPFVTPSFCFYQSRYPRPIQQSSSASGCSSESCSWAICSSQRFSVACWVLPKLSTMGYFKSTSSPKRCTTFWVRSSNISHTSLAQNIGSPCGLLMVRMAPNSTLLKIIIPPPLAVPPSSSPHRGSLWTCT